VERVINGGGIPQHNKVLNQVYANVLGKPVLVPNGTPVSIGSGIFALVAAKVFTTIEEAQEKMCLSHIVYEPQSAAVSIYERLFQLYRRVYFALGVRAAQAIPLGDVLPELRSIAAEVQGHG
jgi:L-ribulokinase